MSREEYCKKYSLGSTHAEQIMRENRELYESLVKNIKAYVLQPVKEKNEETIKKHKKHE